jgi:outer membrane PBP1 activator LpoA protein
METLWGWSDTFRNMRILLLPIVLVLGLVLAGCGGATGPDLATTLNVDPAAAPAYQVTDEERSESADITRHSATLIIPEVTVSQATAALAQWASTSDAEYVAGEVVRAADAKTYVCTLRVAANGRVAQVLMGSAEQVELNCPDPGGK